MKTAMKRMRKHKHGHKNGVDKDESTLPPYRMLWAEIVSKGLRDDFWERMCKRTLENHTPSFIYECAFDTLVSANSKKKRKPVIKKKTEKETDKENGQDEDGQDEDGQDENGQNENEQESKAQRRD